VKLYNLLGHGLLSPFRMLSCNSILPEAANRVLFFFKFAQVIVPYRCNENILFSLQKSMKRV
ncbi:MAG: hypothetical protein IJV43_05155, partial [Oscillospiraceae bacterium]|nr:hypothetical protein [Oscillospiraceae bacterium]